MLSLLPNAGPGVASIRHTGSWIKASENNIINNPPRFIEALDLAIDDRKKPRANGIVESGPSYTELRRGNEVFNNSTVSPLTSTEVKSGWSFPS